MTDNSLVNDTATDATSDNLDNQAQVTKTYSQDEVDNMMARMKGSLEKKLLKPYEGLGDPTELRTLKEQAEAKAQADAIKRGEFEKTLQDLAAKKDFEIQKRDSVIKEYKVNTPLDDCCMEQSNIKKYPFLKSPDYAFNNDSQTRTNYFNKNLR